jgi:hypothetical protein
VPPQTLTALAVENLLREDDADDEDDEVRLTVEGEEAHLRIPGGSDFQDCEATA